MTDRGDGAMELAGIPTAGEEVGVRIAASMGGHAGDVSIPQSLGGANSLWCNRIRLLT
ncbi:hypothetical protein [Nocardia sp. NPDC005998]|uniref:hypothetical protein n=1 Tax=Nocardia sp. NPDC005998 TaxID=3156894 RepID=UPI0033B11BD1